MTLNTTSSQSGGQCRKDHIDPALSLVILVLFAAIVAALGGSSRPDATQIVALRPLAALFVIPALYCLNWAQFREAKWLLVFMGLLTGWMALQLVPMPPAWWQSLPGRGTLAELGSLAGLDSLWRPIAWVPSRGWNALFSLIVPIAALLLGVALRANSRILLMLVLAVGLLDAMIGLLQVISGGLGSLYFYAITNHRAPVGIFANENHSAVLSAIVLLVIARLGATAKAENDPHWLRLIYPPAFVVVLLAVLVSGSRAGMAVAILALIASAMMVWLSLVGARRRKRRGKVEKWLANHPRTLLLTFASIIVLLILAFFFLDRAPGFEDIFSKNAFENLRWQLLPVLQQLAGTYWLSGIGFGSFEELYHIHEPTALLLPNYVNQAHNDWLQFVIEGGLPAIGLLVALLTWMAFSLRAVLKQSEFGFGRFIFWGAAFAIISAASIIDYPLRTPIFMLVATWLLLALALERRDADLTQERG